MTKKIESDFIPFQAEKSMPKGRSLVFAPHPDDEVFGCGGAIIRHLQQKDEVKVVIVTDGDFPVSENQGKINYLTVRKTESIKAAGILGYESPEFLGYKDRLLKASEEVINHFLSIISTYKPKNIYLPASTEIHPDHIATNKAVIEASKRYEINIRLFCYEIGYALKPNLLHNITDLQPQLEKAMDCFSSQEDVQNYKRHITALHIYRTYTLGKMVQFAEAYNLINSLQIKSGDKLWQQKFKKNKIFFKEKSEDIEYPLISIIVRTMNRPQLPEALESIANQTYPNLEVIVVDAQDKKPLQLGNHCGKFPMRIVSKGKPLNRPQAANTGLEVLEGRYFSFLDEDDIILPKHIQNLYSILKDSKAPAAYDVTEKKDKNGNVIFFKSNFDYLTLFWGNYIPNMALLCRSSIIAKGVKFDESLKIYEDWDFVLQTARKGDFIFLPEKGSIYRDLSSSGVQDNRKKIKKYREKIYQKWLPVLNEKQMTELLLRLDYLDINDYKQTEQIKEYNKILEEDCKRYKEKNKILKTHLQQQYKKLEFSKKNIEKIKQQLDLLSETIRKKEVELKHQKIEYDAIIQGIKNSKSYKIAKSIVKVTKAINLNFFTNKLNLNVHIQDKKLLKNSDLFDSEYYLSCNPDVKEAGIDPIKHYLLYGGFEGRNPSGEFNSAFYLEQNPDVKTGRLNPLLHYLKYGRSEGRSPLPKKVLKKRI